jgi:hypothetical protein
MCLRLFIPAPGPYSVKQRKCTDEENRFWPSRGSARLLWGPPILLRYSEQKFFEQGPEYITKIPTKIQVF